ncbi:oligosaccharide flippase family protein, partial [bacterium]|nr:oligosaccharide flippase family protein [bacterium]
MSKTKRLLRNTIAIIIAKGIQPLFSTVLVYFIVRIWSPEDFGKYNALFYLLAIFQVLCGFGLRSTLTREVARNRDFVHQYISNGIIVAIPFSILSMLFMIGVVHILQYESYLIINSYILSISLIASAFGECFEGILCGFERIRSIAIIWIVETILKTGLSIVLVYSGFGILAIVVTFVVFRFFNPIACFFVIRRSFGKLNFGMDIGLINGLIKTTYIVAIIEIVATIYWRIDVVILERMLGDVDAGLFGAVHRLFWFSQMLITTFYTAFLPVISRLYAERRDA